jgi:hypothetical protein
MIITIRPVSTIEFIGLSETNTIGYYECEHEEHLVMPKKVA